MNVLNTLNSYGSGFQIKVISSLLKHKEFLQNIIDVLDPNEFDNPSHKWIITETIKYYQKYHTTPTPEFLSIEVRKMDNDVLKVSVAEQLKEDWIAQYCNSFETEAVHRCSRAAPFDKNVSLWYQKHFGVDYEDFRKITINHRK